MGDSLLLSDRQEGIQTIHAVYVEKRPENLLFNDNKEKVNKVEQED